MYAQAEKSKENKSGAVANSFRQKKDSVKQDFGFVDNRLETVSQRKLQEMSTNNTSQSKLTIQLQIVRTIGPKQSISLGASVNFPIQRKRSHAKNFIERNELGIDWDKGSVKEYIDKTSNSKVLRQGLLKEWNKNQIPIHRIDTPADLQATSTSFTQMGDLEEWNSEDEDDWDMGKVIPMRKKGEMDLIRSGKIPDKTKVPQMDIFDAVRFGRQANKRDEYDRFPMSIDLGGHQIEYDNPGTKDIYATPLDEVVTKAKKLKGSSIRKKYKRAGQSKDYNWKTLSSNLKARKYKNKRQHQLKILGFFLKKGELEKIDGPTAEALAAIGSDLMKGSRGGRFHLRKAIRKIQTNKSDYSFSKVFSGKNPIYEPAAVGGRSLVSRMNEQIQLEANRLLGVNNCLINAIALAAGLPMPNLGVLMRIRERLGNYGEMLFATNESIAVIRQVLGINTAIAVIYHNRPSEDFVGIGGPLLIYHVNENHFTHNMPKDFTAYPPKK